MEKTEMDYAAFERAMDEEKVYLRNDDFNGICSLLGADAGSLDGKLFEELGFHGQELVEAYLAAGRNIQ